MEAEAEILIHCSATLRLLALAFVSFHRREAQVNSGGAAAAGGQGQPRPTDKLEQQLEKGSTSGGGSGGGGGTPRAVPSPERGGIFCSPGPGARH